MGNDPPQVLHVMFSVSGAAALRTALAEAGRPARVIALPDDLSFGPINPPDPRDRAQWIAAELDDDWSAYLADWSQQIEAFWADALSTDYRLVAWTSRRSASDYCGFLEWLQRLGDGPCQVIDVTDLVLPEQTLRDGRVVPPQRPIGTGAIPFSRLPAQLFDSAEALSPAARASYHATWRRLRTEDDALRVIADDGLESVPLSYFDELILSHAKPEWLKAARVVGGVLADHWSQDLCQVGDQVLWARIRALAAAGRLEYRGDLASLRTTEVRRA